MGDYRTVFRVGYRTCELSATVRGTGPRAGLAGMEVTWSPDIPGELSADEKVQYLAGRANFMATLSLQLGGAASVIEP